MEEFIEMMLLKIVKLFQYQTVRPNTPYVVISSEVIKSTLNMSDKESSIKRVTS